MSLTLHVDPAGLYRLLSDLSDNGTVSPVTNIRMNWEQKSVKDRLPYVDVYSFDVDLDETQAGKLRDINAVDSLKRKYEK